MKLKSSSSQTINTPSGSQSLVAPGGGADCEGAASTPLLGHLGLKGPPPWGRPRVPGATSRPCGGLGRPSAAWALAPICCAQFAQGRLWGSP